MKNKKNNYWENENPETVEYGNRFMRYYPDAGKLQFGFINAKGDFIVKNVLDRDEVTRSDEATQLLYGVLNDWTEGND